MLLILVVGLLAGVAVAGVCVQLDGISVMGKLHLDQLFGAPRTEIPTQIIIGRDSGETTTTTVPSNDSAIARPAGSPVAPGISPAASQPTSTTAVVPGDVYAYPPDSSRGGKGPGGGSGSGGDGSGSGGGGHGSRGGG
ncbi:MAG: hypothetical protein E6J41_00955 [Chloroflexi bacterium]|nr:MAG: hypothetical protein E6J41_00955 [Chloroflexota bacterium]